MIDDPKQEKTSLSVNDILTDNISQCS